MKRRLVLSATTLALVAGIAGIASAATPSPNVTPSAGANPEYHQVCLVFYYDDGSKPSHLCLNY